MFRHFNSSVAGDGSLPHAVSACVGIAGTLPKCNRSRDARYWRAMIQVLLLARVVRIVRFPHSQYESDIVSEFHVAETRLNA